MGSNTFKSTRLTAGLTALALLMAGEAAFAQQQVNLTAGSATATLPDGSAVPMWGYGCGTPNAAASMATCASLNPAVAVGGWAPVIITLPAGQDLQITLTNNLPGVPTSIVIVGQLGGGLGNSSTSTPSPDHSLAQSNVTWPIVNNGGGSGTPPLQGNRVQSFSSEVASGATSVTGQNCWGLTCPTPTPALKPGTYLIESGTHPSIQGPMGLYGMLVVTAAPSVAGPGIAYPATTFTGVAPTLPVTYSAEVPLLLSEIDPVQNAAVAKAVTLPGFLETTVWSGLPGGCGNPATANSGNCYPPAVNYTPLYYLFNGVAFDKSNSPASLFPVSAGTPTGATLSGHLLV